jgi:diacylglycerol kinase family enzyme
VSAPTDTVYVVNRAAGSGRAGRCWDRLAREVPTGTPGLIPASPEAIAERLDATLTEATRRVIAVGGDGTFH